MKTVAEMEFPKNDASPPFKLADGHSYFLHRLQRDGKTTTYALIAAEGASGAFTPYLPAHQMDRVLEMRSSPPGVAQPVDDPKAPTGYRCPGCGAVVTETGVHVGPADAKHSDRTTSDPTGPAIAIDDAGQIELLPKQPSPASRFFDRS